MEYEVLREEYANREYTFKFPEGNDQQSEEESEKCDFDDLKLKLLSKMNELHATFIENPTGWRNHTAASHPYSKISKVFQKSNIHTSQAFCKFLEILTKFPGLITDDVKNERKLRSFHLCEGPGNFIAGLDRYLCANYPILNWEWVANTLNPYYENTPSGSKLLDDSYMINHMKNWDFGPNNSGDITQLNAEYLSKKEYCGKFHLVTADGSFYVQNNPENQESLVFQLLEAEIDCALNLLCENGSLVMKMFAMHEEKTRKLLEALIVKFDTCTIFKPICSKSGNSERYVICTGFSRNSSRQNVSNVEFYECEKMFTNRQIDAMSQNIRTIGTEDTNKERRYKNRLVDSFLGQLDFQRLSQPIRESHIFPEESVERRPWSVLFGNNLCERMNSMEFSKESKDLNQENLFENMSISITSKKTVELSFDESSWDIIFTPEEVLPAHSLFINPAILSAFCADDKKRCFDIFANCSVLDRQVGAAPFEFDSVEGTADCCNFKSFKDFADLLGILIEKNAQSVNLVFQSPGTPLILSRLSASIIAIFNALFSRFENRNQGISFSEQRPENIRNIENLLVRIFNEGQNLPVFLRNFVSVNVHAAVFPMIYDFNCKALRDC